MANQTAFDWLIERPIAHRGLHDVQNGIFENTLTAFERAIAGNYAIECDLQFSADGVPVVFHDFDLKRLCGLNGKTRERMAHELSQLSVGGSKDKIPTLTDMLALVCGKVPLIIELKGQEKDDYGFAGAVLEALETYKGPVALMSFDHHLLKDFRALGCEQPLGLTAEGAEPERFFKHEEALSLGLDFISYHIGHLPNPFIKAQRTQNMPIITWTVRDKTQMDHSNLYADQITFEGFNPDE